MGVQSKEGWAPPVLVGCHPRTKLLLARLWNCRVELRRFGGAFERRCSCFAACDCLLDRVEVAGADEALVLHRIVAILLGTEFRFLSRLVGHGFSRDIETQRKHPVPLGGILAEAFAFVMVAQCLCVSRLRNGGWPSP